MSDWLHIDTWLSSLYQDRPIPYFERTNNNYELLSELKNLNSNSSLLAEKTIKIIQDNTSEMIDSKNLSKPCKNDLCQLTLISQSLGLHSTELSNYYTALSKLTLSYFDINNEENNLTEIEHALDKSKSILDIEVNKMNEVLVSLQKKKLDQLADNPSQLMGEKASEHQLEKKYLELDNTTTISELHDLESSIKAIERKLKLDNLNLASLHTLPSDMTLASFKIQETKDELLELEKERELLITNKIVL